LLETGTDLDGNGYLDPNEVTSSEIICYGDGRDSIANTYTISPGIDCDDGGILLETGTDLDGNGYLDPNEVTSSEIICNGISGSDGQDGSTALIETSNEPAGNNCANGGVKIEAGVDDNGDGQLDANEVDSTQYICDGGSSATTMLTSYSTPPTSMGCDIGGSVIAHGLDNGDGGGTTANGQLESGEVDYSTTFCTKSTLLRIDIYPGSSHGYPADLTVFNNELYFTADDGINGYELWEYDGVNAPSMVADINPGSNPGGSASGSNPAYLTVFNDELYFQANDGTHGTELWKYDGVNAPSMVADITPGSSSSLPGDLTVFNNELYFRAYDGTSGYELWRYDGT
ncbi:MAG: hypothetical protein VXY53_08045, partial [Candidatus Thermoplasmatota archaeon]|nr:hypothetical protein [Candidatus Thermoplasmatota archaeon]